MASATTTDFKLLDYHLDGIIGRAASGAAEVFVAKKDDRFVSIRIYPIDDETVSLEEIMKEIFILRQMKNEGVLSVLDCFLSMNMLCMVTPNFDCGSVIDIINSGFVIGLPQKPITYILFRVLQAIVYIHRQNIVHRGIRCKHILVKCSGQIVISGFRYHCRIPLPKKDTFIKFSKLVDFSPVLANNLCWLAPEILKQDLEGYGLKSDIYSLGVTICEMANGFAPFTDMEPLQMLFEKERGTTPRLLDQYTLPKDDENVDQRSRRFAPELHQLTDSCLKHIAAHRPSAAELLKSSILKVYQNSPPRFDQILSSIPSISSIASSSSAFNQNRKELREKSAKFWDF